MVGFSDLVEVGRGGFSRVFSAYQMEFDRRVALKVLNDRLADEASVGVFEGECRAMGTLSQHPFIVTVLASALTADYRPVIVMELFERGNYMQLLRRDGPLPLEELLSLSVRVGGALATAHHHGVIHGDVKPQNVLKSEFGFPALGDFGIATLRNRLSERAATGLSAHYAAPELIESGATAAGAAADQYSLAATIFTLATGKRPFEGTTPGEAPERVLARVLGSPTPRLPAPFPEELTDTLARAMSRDPQRRFPDLGAFAFALAAVEHRLGYRATAVPLVGIDDDATITVDDTTRSQLHTTPPPPPGDETTIALPPQQPPPPPSAPPSPPNRRRRLAALLVLLLAAAGAATYLTVGSDTPGSQAETTPTPVSAPVSSDGGGLSVSPDGVFTLTVFGTDYVLPGPPGGVRGALLPGEVSSWIYDFEAATFVAGEGPAEPFDPSIRRAAGDYEIAWVSPIAASETVQDVEDAIRSTAAASGVHIGVVCDGALDPAKMLACADTVAASDVDAVIFGNIFGEVAESAMEVFDEAGLPVITFDVWHPNAVFVGADSYESGAVAGVNAGRHALDAWDCAGVHVLLGDALNIAGRDNLDLALTGFTDGVRAVCGTDVAVSRIETTADIQQHTMDWLAANPTVSHVIASSVTDDLAVHMSRAIQQTGRSGIAAAPNAGPAGAARLSEGPPAETRYLGAAATLPETYGTTAIAALIDILEGRPVPQEIHTDHTWLNHTNIDQHTNPQDPPTPNPDTPPNPPDPPDPPGNTFTAITAGSGHSCGLRADDTIECWGWNEYGQVGAPAGTFTAITAGEGHSCGLRADSTITCWGYNEGGQADTPAGTFTAVSAGSDHSCGVRTDKTIVCWGTNESGETEAPAGAFTAVSAGSTHSCGLRTDNTAGCWGSNWAGRVEAPAGTFTAVSAGSDHSCGVRTDDTITCWGTNWHGETEAPAGAFTAVSAGYSYSCGLRTDSTIECWGNNEYGQVDAPAGAFTAVSAGRGHSCGLRTDSTITCWGATDLGRVGAPAGTFTAVTASSYHSCGLQIDNTITCWGYNEGGQADAPAGTFTAVAVGGLHSCGLRADSTIVCWGNNDGGRSRPPAGTFTAISAGSSHSCGLRTDNTITCWGTNESGATEAPVGAFTAVTAGSSHSCGLRTDNTITCWGDNSARQADAPAGAFTAVTAGQSHSCGLRTDNTITCWGDNSARQADAPAGAFTAVTAGQSHSCGLRTDNTITCWGDNSARQADAPAGAFTAVTAGQSHSCGLRTDNTITCWNWVSDLPAGVHWMSRA